MIRPSADANISRRLLLLWAFAFAAAALSLDREPLRPVEMPVLLLLAALAVAAELLPVELPRRGVRITFALPFIAAIGFSCGGSYALIVDILAASLVSAAMIRSRAQIVELRWLLANSAISAGSAGVSAVLMGIAQSAGWPSELLEVVFIGVYAVVNYVLVGYVEWSLTNRAWSENTSTMAITAAICFALYALIGLIVAVMMGVGWYLATPLVLVPVWALRTGLTYRARSDQAYYETITALTQMLQRAHPYTHGHLERVSLAAEEVARRLRLSPRRARLVREAAVLHDIGKIAVNEAILDKPGKLTPEELSHVRLHSGFGAQILAPVRTLAPLVPWIRHHHERPDGTGYPDALPSDEIPIESKIIAVVDAFDAMTGTEEGMRRPYRDPMTEAEALDELDRCAGTQFDRDVVDAFRASVMGVRR